MLLRVLLVSNDSPLRERIRRCLPAAALLGEVTPEALEERLAREPTDLVLWHAPEPRASLEPVRALREGPDRPGVIVLAAQEDPEQRALLLTAGCLAVVYQGLPDPLLSETLGALLERHRSERSRSPDQEHFRLRDYASASPAMQRFLHLAERAAASESTLLLLGETGAGKEWLARAIHAESSRRKAPFVALSCAAMPEALLESELFGHEKGAFTGASRSHRGLFELAHRGTLFLDEVGELPLHLQAKLLRVLEEPRIRPVGSERTVAVDVRIMAATNRDLAAEVRAGRFRQDLFYRLDVLALALPPLRERREDIPPLVESYREHFRVRLRRDVQGTEPEALDALLHYPWPGNVRELINVMERAVLLAEGPRLRLADLPPAIAASGSGAAATAAPTPAASPPSDWLSRPWRQVRAELLERAERQYLAGLLEACQGRLWEVAQRAGIEPRSLFDKMRHHGLRKEDFRATRREAPASAAAPGEPV